MEFDKIRYPDIKSCEEWLKGTRELETILQIRGFRLRINKKCHYLTHEPRAVYSYYSGTWKYPQLMIEGPNPHVVVVKASADTQPFVDADLPELLPETIAKQATRREKEVRRQEKELKRCEARKAQRRAAAGKKQNQKKRKEKHDSDEIEEGQRKKNSLQSRPNPSGLLMKRRMLILLLPLITNLLFTITLEEMRTQNSSLTRARNRTWK